LRALTGADGGRAPDAYDGGVNARSFWLYTVLRILFFLVPFGILMLLPIGREFYWLSAIFAALIGLSLSVIFLRRPLDEVSASLAERRARRTDPTDEQVEDATLEDAPAADEAPAPSAGEGPEEESSESERRS
jgi:hypothetical protein|tara:strand:- start:2388 stop:2786 length:399 start_codon:yes stop_codon:yes gene_type:complete